MATGPDDDDDALGTVRLADYMEYYDKKDREVADYIGTGRVNVTRWRLGRRKFDRTYLVPVARFFGVNPLQMYQKPGLPDLNELVGDNETDREDAAALLRSWLRRK